MARYLAQFHNEDEEPKRQPKEAFIPAANAHLQAMARVNGHLLQRLQDRHPMTVATLDMDVTLIEVHKQTALYCYKKYLATQDPETNGHPIAVVSARW